MTRQRKYIVAYMVEVDNDESLIPLQTQHASKVIVGKIREAIQELVPQEDQDRIINNGGGMRVLLDPLISSGWPHGVSSIADDDRQWRIMGLFRKPRPSELAMQMVAEQEVADSTNAGKENHGV